MGPNSLGFFDLWEGKIFLKVWVLCSGYPTLPPSRCCPQRGSQGLGGGQNQLTSFPEKESGVHGKPWHRFQEVTAIQLWIWGPPLGRFLVPSSDVDQLFAVCWLRFPWLQNGGISCFRAVDWLRNAGTQLAPWVWAWETLHLLSRNIQLGLPFLSRK